MFVSTENPGLAPAVALRLPDLTEFWPLVITIVITIIVFALTLVRFDDYRILPINGSANSALGVLAVIALVIQGVVLVNLGSAATEADRFVDRDTANEYRSSVQRWLLDDYGIVASDASVRRLGEGESIVLQVPMDVGSPVKTPLNVALLPADDGIAVREVDGPVLAPIHATPSDQNRDANG